MATDTPRTEAGLRQTLATYAPLVKRDGYLNIDALIQTLRPYLAIEAEPAAGPRDEGLREALKSIVEVLGPNEPEHAGICEGCAVEMGEALDIARAALAKADADR